jgi:NhaA family Na+:H+ antiporter
LGVPASSRRLPTQRVLPALFGAAVRPLQAFFRLEAASGIVLLACAVAALAWVNFVGPSTYRAVFDQTITLGFGDATARFTLLTLVNDGLMAVFFFLVGMEIKRELVIGELRSAAQALLPAAAALGGMVVPAALFLAFNAGAPGQAGWGIPMATDIAFCVGILTLLKKRVPHALIVFLTALAIFDDIGGIIVIAFFYGSGLDLPWLLASAAIVAALVLMSRRSVQGAIPYAVAGALLWYTLHAGGIHATIAGVVLGFAIPARARSAPREVLRALSERTSAHLAAPADEALDAEALLALGGRLSEHESPLDRFIRRLHAPVAFGVMPLFALANSGVDLRGLDPSRATGRVAVGVALALFLGKQVGIFAFTLAAVKLGLAALPGNASATKVLGVSMVAGIGFTVAMFIAALAYPGSADLLDEAKLGILAGSLASGLLGALVLRLTAPVESTPPSRSVSLSEPATRH